MSCFDDRREVGVLVVAGTRLGALCAGLVANETLTSGDNLKRLYNCGVKLIEGIADPTDDDQLRSHSFIK